MLGPGLSEALEELADKSRRRSRFRIELPNQRLSLQLSKLLEVMFALTRDWKCEDASLLFDMMRSQNNEAVAVAHGKNRSQVCKRHRNLYVDQHSIERGPNKSNIKYLLPHRQPALNTICDGLHGYCQQFGEVAHRISKNFFDFDLSHLSQAIFFERAARFCGYGNLYVQNKRTVILIKTLLYQYFFSCPPIILMA